jgi:hypothetical protein
VTGIRFYKGAGNTGTHVGSLWSSNGVLLGRVNFTGESATGWQQASFAEPIAITPGATYVASYYAPNGHYALELDYFTTFGVVNAGLLALDNTTAVGNGVYRYGSAPGFPIESFRASNYWVDLLFVPF